MESNESGFTVISNDIIRHPDLPATEKIVLLSLLSYLNAEQQRAWPSISTLATCANVSEYWARELLKSLELRGYIKAEKRPGHVTRYEILTPQLSCPRNIVAPATELRTPRNNVAPNPATELPPPRNIVAPINTNTNTNRQVPNTNTKTPAKIAKKSDADFEADFEEFWKAYPKPKNPDKTPGKQKYIALRKKGVSADDLLKAAQNYAQAMRGTDPRYIKHCTTFLGPSDAWRDYLQAEEPKTAQQAHEDGEAEYMRDATAAGLFSLEEYRAWRAKNGF